MVKPNEEKHNKALDMLHDYKIHLQNQVIELKKLDQKSEFMKKWNEETIKEREQEIDVIAKILRSLIRY